MAFRYSAINTSYFCQEKYRRVYILGERERGSLDLEFGTAIHSAIAAHFAGQDALGHFSTMWEMVDQSLPKSRYDYAQLSQIGEVLMAKWTKRHAEKYKPLHVEKRIAFMVGNHAFEGTPDFIGHYQDKLSVVDWKTSGYSYDKRKPNVDEQLWIYVSAIKQAHGLDIEQVVYAPLVKDGASIQNPLVLAVTPERLEEKLANVQAVCDDLAGKTVFIKNRSNCMKCGFYSGCYQEK